MAYATFGGLPIFGYQLQMQTVDNPRAHQMNAYPGLSGLESLDQGLRGRYTICAGRLAGTSLVGLAAAEETFRAFNDGSAYPLYDTRGVIWFNVKLEGFQPEGKIFAHATGGFSRRYTARFLHL